MTMTRATLFTPVQFGAMQLKHRVVMAPLTRSRSIQPDSIPGDLMAEYYAQRASEGGFIIGEATNISVTSRGWLGAPGLYSDQQVEGWKKVISGIHAKGGHMFAQLWHTGRSSHVDLTGGEMPVSASVDPAYWHNPSHLVSASSGWVQPSPHRALAIAEISLIVEDYRRAAERAMDAGFEGVELHAANGYLMDQFLQDGSNKRNDEYGGSIENRSRFLLEVVRAMTSVWGSDRVGVRVGPSGTWNGMSDSNPQALFQYVAEQLNQIGLAYLHIIEPRVKGNVVVLEHQGAIAAEQMRTIFQGKIIRICSADLSQTLPRPSWKAEPRTRWLSAAISSLILTCLAASRRGCHLRLTIATPFTRSTRTATRTTRSITRTPWCSASNTRE